MEHLFNSFNSFNELNELNILNGKLFLESGDPRIKWIKWIKWINKIKWKICLIHLIGLMN